MIWRWVICFSVAALSARAASISGTVVLRDSRIEAVRKLGDYSGVVVSVTAIGSPSPSPPAKHATMIQKGKSFTPHLLPISAGTTVDFPNFDPIFHNAFSSFNGQIFDVGLYPPGSSRSVRFTRTGVVRVFCNIHPSMSAIILALSTPYFTQTSKDGSFSIDVPPGSYELNVFHERATEQTLQQLSQRVLVAGAAVRVPAITVSEAGYLPMPHKNKYGRDYAPPPDDQVAYPGKSR